MWYFLRVECKRHFEYLDWLLFAHYSHLWTGSREVELAVAAVNLQCSLVPDIGGWLHLEVLQCN